MADLREIKIPDLGSDDPVPVAEVFMTIGQEVEAEEPLLAMESDKAVMEIPSPFAGVIKEIKVKEGDMLKTGDVIAMAETAGEETPAPPSEKPEAPATPEPQKPSVPEPPKAPVQPEKSHETPPVAAVEAPLGKVPHASPSIRRFARELGVSLASVQGSAPKGRVTKEDIQNYVKNLIKTGGSGTGTGLPSAAYVDPSKFGSVREEELTRIQKISGPHLHASWVNIPHVTQYEQADITYLETWRKELNQKADQGVKFSVLAFVIKALYKAVEEYPRFNSVLDPGGEKLFIRNYYNIGIAVDTPQGLLVPVIHDVDKMNLTEIVLAIKDLALRGRDGQLKPADLQGAGISISNLGGIGGTSFTPIINPPEVAILGLSRSTMQPVWNGSDFEPRLMLPLSLSYDHRVIDGAMAAKFIRYLADLLEDMKKILL